MDNQIEINQKKEQRDSTVRTFVLRLVLVLACMGIVLMIWQYFENQYGIGVELQNEGKWKGAIEVFDKLGGYSDSELRIIDCYLSESLDYLNNCEWELALQSVLMARENCIDTSQIQKTYYYEGNVRSREGKWDEAIGAYLNAEGYNDALIGIQKAYYAKGEEAQSYWKWDEAIKAFQNADGYDDSEKRILETYYYKGIESLSNQKWYDAEKAFLAAGQYRDAEEQVKNVYYQHAKERLANGYYSDTYELLMAIPMYKDASSILETNKYLGKIAEIDKIAIEGYTFSFGTYKRRRIGWKILERDGMEAYCFALSPVANMPFNSIKQRDSKGSMSYATTWNSSTLSSWLHGEFVREAFSEKENKYLKFVTLPSKEDVEKYDLEINQIRWWTSTIGHHAYGETVKSEEAYFANSTGYLSTGSVRSAYGVRPIIRISIDAFIQ